MDKRKTWVLVADGQRADLYALEGAVLRPVLDYQLTAVRRHTGEATTDRLPRTHDSVGPGRHSIEPHTDIHRREKAEFAQDVAEVVNNAAEAGRFNRLIIAAPPKTLGDLRPHLSDKTRALVTHDFAKELTHLSPADLWSELSRLLSD